MHLICLPWRLFSSPAVPCLTYTTLSSVKKTCGYHNISTTIYYINIYLPWKYPSSTNIVSHFLTHGTRLVLVFFLFLRYVTTIFVYIKSMYMFEIVKIFYQILLQLIIPFCYKVYCQHHQRRGQDWNMSKSCTDCNNIDKTEDYIGR